MQARVLFTLTLSALLRSAALSAQPCDDSNECTANDVCSGTQCIGISMPGASCTPFSERLVNFHCVDNGTRAFCSGDPAPEGSPCERGCGILQPLESHLP